MYLCVSVFRVIVDRILYLVYTTDSENILGEGRAGALFSHLRDEQTKVTQVMILPGSLLIIHPRFSSLHYTAPKEWLFITNFLELLRKQYLL